MPRELSLSPDQAAPGRRMLPAPAPSTVWARARREFAMSRIEQLPLRGRLLDVLEHMNRGNMLALMGAAVPAVWLDGHPDIPLLAGVLFTYGYVQIAGHHRDNPHVVYFTLSEAGLHKLREGRAWWRRLSFWQRLRVRVLG